MQSNATRRFWSHVQITDSCWLWTAALSASGYGGFGLDGTHVVQTHRLSWELAYGPIPDGLCVLHHCDVRACLRPEHLFLGTRLDNVRDMRTKGRENRVFTQWPRGERHPGVKLTESQVLAIRARYADGDISPQKLADAYGMSRYAIRALLGLVAKKTWVHLP